MFYEYGSLQNDDLIDGRDCKSFSFLIPKGLESMSFLLLLLVHIYLSECK